MQDIEHSKQTNEGNNEVEKKHFHVSTHYKQRKTFELGNAHTWIDCCKTPTRVASN
jgi:hypothetical protein